MPTLPAISFKAGAISNAWSRHSSAHGPAIKVSGKALPKRALPTATTGLGVGSTCSIACLAAGPCRPWVWRSTAGTACLGFEYEGRPHGVLGRDDDRAHVGRRRDAAGGEHGGQRGSLAHAKSQGREPGSGGDVRGRRAEMA